ncbi:hypothetical protein [Vibrio kanaloae]|uniref:hypothetical protein n=1 Tax=Vibrio kanaloae TaxID=170673 RepID=UPI000988B46F|nr:hypothetical protein [Vibrio kanaloae]QPK06295.1 hypothetical protein BTD91_20660 [Vibrio kanaloae]
MKKYLGIAIISLVSGCSSIGGLPPTLGESAGGFGYVPLDGLAVHQTLEADSCENWRGVKEVHRSPGFFGLNDKGESGVNPYLPLLEALPDISVRFAVASFDNTGGLTFGPAKITAQGKNYRAILDYINADAIPVSLWVTAFKNKAPIKVTDMDSGSSADYYEAEVYTTSNVSAPPYDVSQLVTIPVYVGIGMRLSADITAIEGGIPLTSLGGIGVEAQSKRLTGTLTVQTIGISGESVATSLPLPSSLSQSTIENGILSIGSNRAIVYRTDSGSKGIYTVPRVVGMYSPIGSDAALVNAIYSELSKNPPKWARPCKPYTS